MTLQAVARDEATAEFFDGTAAGVYLIKRCAPHGHASKAQSTVCSMCASEDLRWDEASGRAKLASWAVIPGKPSEPDGTPPEPTVVAIGELEEGPWIWAQLRRVDPADVRDGMALRIDFERPPGSEAIPVLVPADL
jgi:uncharacterized OB-fold protein